MSLSKSLCDCLALKPAKLFFQEEDLITGVWDQPEKAMAAHSSTLAWRIPWMEEPGRLQSMGSRRVGHDRVTSLSLFTFMHWRRKWQPTPVFLPGESQGRGAWWAAVYGVAQSRTGLKRLSSSSVGPTPGRIIVVNSHRWSRASSIKGGEGWTSAQSSMLYESSLKR